MVTRRRPFDYLLELDCAGDVRDAVKRAAAVVGMSYTQNAGKSSPGATGEATERYFTEPTETDCDTEDEQEWLESETTTDSGMYYIDMSRMDKRTRNVISFFDSARLR